MSNETESVVGSGAAAPAWVARWIAIEEGLPPDGWCLVRPIQSFDAPAWVVDFRREDDAFYPSSSAGGGWFEVGEVTHWMPLPKPPRVAAAPPDTPRLDQIERRNS